MPDKKNENNEGQRRIGSGAVGDFSADQHESAEGRDMDRCQRLIVLVGDACELLDYAISVGASIPDPIIEVIRSTQTAVRKKQVDDEKRISFEKMYRDLAALMSPVSVQSLRNTEPSVGRHFFGGSRAETWSRILWFWTWVTILSIVGIEVAVILRTGFVPIDVVTDADLFAEASRGGAAFLHGAEFLLPFLYGALGACAYLLRSCHKAIHTRTFDPLRRAEYLNRILLGIISGGAIGLFGGDLFDTETIEGFGKAFLGFLAGYNSDFLFTAIERLIAALLPKVEAQQTIARSSHTEKPAALRDQA